MDVDELLDLETTEERRQFLVVSVLIFDRLTVDRLKCGNVNS